MRGVAGLMGLVQGMLLVGGCTLQGGAQTSTMPPGGEVPVEGDGGGGGGGGGGGMIEAGCSFNGHQLQGEVGDEFEVSCPANCEAEGATWGSELYTFDSAICRAGIHAGAIPSSGGVVQVRIEPGRPAYRGSTRNGVQSYDYGQYPKSYAVLNGGDGGGPVASDGPSGEPGPVDDGGDVIEAGCSYNGTQIVGEVGTSVVVNCPAGCASQGGLWGSGPYTLDSGVCRAAVHAGVLSDGGGNVRVTVEPGRPAYRGSEKHGVQAYDYGKYPKSFRVGRP